MKNTKISELRDMSEDQLDVVLKDAKDTLFRLRLQARMERLDSPSELKKNKRLIAQILTLRSLKQKNQNIQNTVTAIKPNNENKKKRG
jgi:large subunit ribosomal protein L29